MGFYSPATIMRSHCNWRISNPRYEPYREKVEGWFRENLSFKSIADSLEKALTQE
jgi:hypothetical protein